MDPANMPSSNPRSSATRADTGSNTEAGWMQALPSKIARKRSRRSVHCMRCPCLVWGFYGESVKRLSLEREQGKRAQCVAGADRGRRVQIRAVEFGPGSDPEQAEAHLDLQLQNLQQAHEARLPACGQSDALHAAEADQAGARRERL